MDYITLRRIGQSLLISCIALLAFDSSLAGQLTVTKTWGAGETLTADDLNQSFTETENAVTDNNKRISTIETQTQDLAVGCPAGQSIGAIAADGTVTCEIDTNTTKSGWWRYDIQGGYGFPTTDEMTFITASIHLPNGVTLSSVSCYFLDNDTTYDIVAYSFNVYRTTVGATTYTTIASAANAVATNGASPTPISITDTSITSPTIDNFTNYYYIRVMMDPSANYTATTSSSIRLQGCLINYTSDAYYILGGDFNPAFTTGPDQ